MSETLGIAAILATVGILLGGSVLLTRLTGRIGIPIALGFIAVGLLAGSEGIGHISFSSYSFAFRAGVVALVLILFDGGLNTPPAALRAVAAPSLTLATLGVFMTTAIVAAFAWSVGQQEWAIALLIGAVVSSTDAAAVFATLRGNGVTLKSRVGRTLEAESGLNDPVAIILVISLTTYALNSGVDRHGSMWLLPLTAAVEIVIGGVAGWIAGRLATRLLSQVRLESSGLYPVLTLAIAIAVFGITTLLHGSGFMAVYLTGVGLSGTEQLPHRPAILRVHDAFAWLAQIGMFLVLGLLASPSRLATAAVPAIELAVVLTFIARPVAVALCLAPFRYTVRESLFLGAVGLRGAVPIVLATIPVMAGLAEGRRIFDVVFFVVVINALMPGTLVAWLARRLRVVGTTTPEPIATIVVESSEPMRGSLRSFFVDRALPVCGVALAEIPFPDGAAVTMIVRGSSLLVADGVTVLQAGDHAYVLGSPATEGLVRLLFGAPEQIE
ncbi:MAG: potassium/proton antiporter [Gemmatimonadota bacterium]|nr:potassium/proton antiporter [Gemmatimonadota bacterium]